MAHSIMLRLAYLITLLAVTSSTNRAQTRWSRQISSYTSDISDWVPLTGPVERDPTPLPQIKRQAVAEPRILTDTFPGVSRANGFGQETFPSRTFYNSPANRQLYLQSVPSVPSAPQNYLTDQGFGQSIRFGLSQSNFPSQGFVAPPFTYENIQPPKPRPQAIPPPPVKFENYHNQLTVAPQPRPIVNQAQKIKTEPPKFIDGYRAENASNEYAYTQKKKPQSLQKIKFENVEKPKVEIISQVQNAPRTEKEEVQLLYVPIESLNRGQFNFRSPISSPQLVNTDLYNQNIPRPNPLKQALTDYQRPVQKPLETLSEQEYFTNFNSQLKDFDEIPKYSTTPYPTVAPTTPKSKKLKPHQPPLAIFLSQETHKNNQMKVGDVLSSLKISNTIAVLDSVNPLNAPNVFIGPSTLTPPENYVKFELPYLSNIENSDKKLKQLPFFVAPLSYNTPQGFAKIPFPSPHVGSVVINSEIKEPQTPQANVPHRIRNSYSAIPPPPPPQRQVYREQKPITQKPSVSFYSTSPPRTYAPTNYQSNFYSFEPQMVSSIEPQKIPETSTVPQKSGNYFIGNAPQQYNPQYNKFQQNDFRPQEPAKYNIPKQTIPTTTTTARTTTTRTTTTRQQSTYPNQLLETHNPYSINQAFHFSTPLDYHNYFDDVKEPIATPRAPEFRSSPTLSPVTTSTAPPTIEEMVTQKQTYQQQTASPNYIQNYTPEVHYESDIQNSRYPVYNPNDDTTKSEVSSEYSQYVDPSNVPEYSVTPTENAENIETQQPLTQENQTEILNAQSIPEVDPSEVYEYNQYETNYNQDEGITSTSTTTTTTTSTRRPIRNRGRPRYTTARTDSNESTSRPLVTRRPLRERRPLPTRQRYEPNKITTEKPTRKPIESYDSSTKSSRTRTRGRVQYKTSDNEELYDRRVKTHNTKQDDLAYQRDVLHQNYPVTLMERTSTVDIEAITEPASRISSTRNTEPITETYDTENAYTNEKVSITQQITETGIKDDIFIPKYTSRATAQTETPYVPKLPSTRNEEYVYHPRSSAAPIVTDAGIFNEAISERDNSYPVQTTPVQKEDIETIPYATEPVSSITEENVPVYSINDELSAVKQEEITTSPDIEVTRAVSQETTHEVEEEEEEENVVQTTPSYNRVRVRPGVIRQYHQASTESSKVKTERRRQPTVTYRPAFDRRRTTMRIEEIEADLKTKQVHSRPEVQDHKHPVYKPDPSTEPSSISSGSQESTTKRGHFRRRRPTYTTTSTEASATRRTYEAKNRFRGRRPTEKSVEKQDQPTEVPTSTTRNPLYTRYSHRPRLSERYNKKTESEEVEDQDSNFSISRPKYAQPENDRWSPKVSGESFKPFNPNEIVDEKKFATTERRSDKISELDIITAKNEFDDILVSVTPTSNRNNKKMPEIPPTLEALVEQSKVTKSDSTESMSTFESMLEEVMKSLEEQDADEYTNNVMKHKGGEIGEIPPERIISSGDTYSQKSTTQIQEATTVEPTAADSTLTNEEENDPKSRRRGFWKKVKVRPVTTESIEAAESQYYTSTVNRLGQPVKISKFNHDKTEKSDKKVTVTTYKPNLQFIKDFFENYDETLASADLAASVEIPKIKSNKNPSDNVNENNQTTTWVKETPTTETNVNPGDFDLGTGSPDLTIDDSYYTTTDPIPTKASVNRSDGFSFMDYLFGSASQDEMDTTGNKNITTSKTDLDKDIGNEATRKFATTESTYIPDEIATENVETTSVISDIKSIGDEQSKEDKTEISIVKVETSSVSSFMNPGNLVSTSMSTQVSHETEICFRGKCIKTNKDIL